MMLRYLRDHNVNLTKHLSLNLVLAITVMSISVFTYGFETAVLDTIQAMTPFERAFGEILPETGHYGFTASKLAYLNSFPLILYALGVIVASQIGERFGRRSVFIGMNFICIIGAALCYTAKSYGQILAGRMIIMMHVGMEAWLVPMFTAEIVPSAVRGSLVAMYTFNHVFASFISSIVTHETSKIDNNNCWKIPLACIFIFPITVLLTFWLVPESPRWLVRRGKYNEAVKVLFYLNGTTPDYPAEEEATLLLQAVENSVTQGKWGDLFKGTNKRRTIHGIIASAFSQLTGVSFASQYGAIFIKSINVMNAFTATMIKRALLCIGTLVVIFFVDKTGRRPMFLIGGFVTAASLMVMGGLGTVQPSTMAVKKGIVAMALLFPVTYINAFGAVLQVFKAELPNITLRDKSHMIFWSVANLCNFVATFTLPYLLKAPYANLGSKVGFIYGSIATVGVVWGFLSMPEMTNKSLEEIDEMFEANIPAWKTKNWKGTQGARITEIENHEVSADPLKQESVKHVEVTRV